MISTAHQPFDTRIFHKEARSLARAGYAVYYVVRIRSEQVRDGVRIVPLPMFSSRILRMLLLPWVALKRAIEIQADIYHFHDPEFMFAAAVLKFITKKAVVYDIHEDVSAQILGKDWIPQPARRLVAWTYRLVERTLLPFYDEVIVDSLGLAAKYISRGKERVVVLHNYPVVPENAWQEMIEEPHSSTLGADTSPQTVVYVGGITRIRGIEQLLRSASVLKHKLRVPYQMKLVGPAQPPEYVEVLSGLIEELGISNEVRMVGQVPYEEALQIMKESAVGVVTLLENPNYTNTLPTKMFEYMLAGLPVVCSNFPLWQEIVSSAECGLVVDPESPEEIASAIAYLLDHPEEAREMGKRGQRAVLATYNWAREEEKLLALYERLVEERSN